MSARANGPGPRHIERTVKPRKDAPPDFLPIVAVERWGTALFERTGELVPSDDITRFTRYIRSEPPSIFVVQGGSELLRRLHEVLSDEPLWQFRVTPVRQEVHRSRQLGGGRMVATRETVVGYFGFTSPNSKKKGHWHHVLDPILFHRHGINAITPDEGGELDRLLRWGQDVRAWCAANNLRVATSPGGLGAQLLRDKRFYPKPRRKVPRADNARARPHLPGNHYRLYTKEGAVHAAVYLDMQSAHHNCAASITFPHSDNLRPRGAYAVTDETLVTALRRNPSFAAGSSAYNNLLRSHGLLLVHLTTPPLKSERDFPPPYMERPGRSLAWVYTNEVPMIRELGGTIEGIEAAWTAFQTDPGLNEYGRWALAEREAMSPERRMWGKGALLSTYGALAARPAKTEFGYARGTGPLKNYPAGSGVLPVHVFETDTEKEMPTVNVIHRGMIEAECRMQVLAMARELTHTHGCRVLSIYADAVFVESGVGRVPLLPYPWSVKQELSRLRFYTPTAFSSVEVTKLPGVTGETRRRITTREHFVRQLDKRHCNNRH